MNQEDLQKLKDTNNCPTGDFEGADLSGMDLRRANLSGAALKKANLSNADMTDANLSVADLTGAKLENAKKSSHEGAAAAAHSSLPPKPRTS